MGAISKTIGLKSYFRNPENMPNSMQLRNIFIRQNNIGRQYNPALDVVFKNFEPLLYKTSREMSNRFLVPNTVKIHWGKINVMDIMPSFSEINRAHIPEAYGGTRLPLGILDAAEIYENIAYGSSSIAAHMVGNGLFYNAILRFGSQAQKEALLRKVEFGKITGSFGLTEPDGGSNPAKMKTHFERSGDKYVLNGAKSFITNAPIADYMVVIAKESGNSGSRQKFAAFIVPSAKTGGGNGFKAGKPWEMAGWSASENSDAYFDNVVLGEDSLLGGHERGMKVALDTISRMRVCIAAQCLGLIERAYDEALKFAVERKTAAEIQGVREKLFRIASTIDEVRLFVYRAACGIMFLDEAGAKDASLASLFKESIIGIIAKSKILASKRLVDAAFEAREIHGAFGLLKESPMSVIWDDLGVYSIVAGANDVLLKLTKANSWKSLLADMFRRK